MSRLVFTSEYLARLRADLLKDEKETCAILFGRSVETNEQLSRITVRESIMPDNQAYAERTHVSAKLKPEFVAEAGQRARRTGESVVFVHTHPFGMNEFSHTDDKGEESLAEFLERRAPNARHAALLLTPEKSLARELGRKRPLRVISVGHEIAWGESVNYTAPPTRYDRQIRAFGIEGQDVLHSLKVAIVGLGGTGTFILQALAHLGVRNFLLIDPDVVEDTNLNRLVGATHRDVGKSKVSVAQKWAHVINPQASIEAIEGSILRQAVAKQLADVDFIFGCTDSHGSRAVLNQLAYQYLIPTIDMGVVISVKEGKVKNIAARTQLLAPGLACMVCGNLLDYEEVRRDLLTDFERKADPYIVGNPEPAPAVISLNGTISSLATTMFLNAAVGIPGAARLLNYNALTGVTRAAVATPHSSCVVCSYSGALARGDEWPLPARVD